MRTTLLLFFVFTSFSYAQTDSARISYSTEDSKWSSAEIKRFIRYITRADVEERTLLKLGFWLNKGDGSSPILDNRNLQIGGNTEISVEQKISKSISFLFGIQTVWGYQSYVNQRFQTSGNSFVSECHIYVYSSWKAGMRYYYVMPKRIKKGLSANNFSGNYIMAQVAEPVRGYNKGKYYDAKTDQLISFRRTENFLGTPTPKIMLAYGLQRRLGHRGYFDINAGPEAFISNSNKLGLILQVNAFIGLGW